jgi:GDP-L-fucose synthase
MEQNFVKFFSGKRCLVTGGTGLIGREVVERLLNYDAIVTSISMDALEIDSRAEYKRGDLTDFNFCVDQMQNIDFVFHLAGVKGSVDVTLSQPASFFVPLLMMNTNVLEAARLNSIKRLVYTSSIGAYEPSEIFVEKAAVETGAPMDSFPGWAKRMAELQIDAYKRQYGITNYSAVRPCNVYGPGDNFDPQNAMVIPSLMARVASGENPLKVWGDGEAIRDFAYSGDVAQGILQTIYHGGPGHYLNLGSGVGTTIRQLVEVMSNIIGFDYEFDLSKSSGFSKRVMDISLARKFVDYRPSTSLEMGIQKTWEWFQLNFSEHKKKHNYFRE